jgi:photosystem II stability/assembly factor-like uncharacterized protein
MMFKSKSFFNPILIINFLLVFYTHGICLAHTPHDVIDAIEVATPANGKDIIFIINCHYRLLRSQNCGVTWTTLVSGLDNRYAFTDIASSPNFRSNHTLYVSTDGDGIYKSEDGGDSWTCLTSLNQFRVHMIAVTENVKDDSRNDIIFAGGSTGGLYRSEDGGKTWQQVLKENIVITSLTTYKDKIENTIIAGDQAGTVYISGDSGRIWKNVMSIPDVGAITCIAAVPNSFSQIKCFIGSERGGLFYLMNDHENFIEAGQGITDKSIQSISFSKHYDQDKAIYVSCWHDAIFKSTDGGMTWNLYASGLSKDKQADSNTIFHSPHFRELQSVNMSNKKYALLLAGFDGLFISDNKGEKWKQLETETAGWVYTLSASPLFQNDFIVGISTFGAGVYFLNNSSLQWEIANVGLRDPRHIGKIFFSPAFPEDKMLFSYEDEGAYLLTRKFGNNNWLKKDLRMGRMLYWKYRIAYHLKRFGVPEGITNYLITQTEKLKYKNRHRANPKGIAVSPDFSSDHTLFVSTRKAGLFQSTDGGNSVKAVNTSQLELWDLKISPGFKKDKTLFTSVRERGIFISHDAGISWEPANHGIDVIHQWQEKCESSEHEKTELSRSPYYHITISLSPFFTDDHTLFATVGSSLYKSVDGGLFWKNISQDLNTRGQILLVELSPSYKTDKTIIMSVKGEGLLKSTDTGKSFFAIGNDLIKNNFLINHLAFSPNFKMDKTIYASSEEEVFRSEDSGDSWELIKRPVRYEDTNEHSMIAYMGNWEKRVSPDFSAGSTMVSLSPDGELEFRFSGEGVKWIGPKSSNYGNALVFLDGKYMAAVDQFSSTLKESTSIYSVNHLEYGPHTLTLKVAKANDATSNHALAVDAFDVLGSADNVYR